MFADVIDIHIQNSDLVSLSAGSWYQSHPDVDTILLANMTEFGKTPYLTADEFGAMGYNIVIFPVTFQRLAMKTVQEALRTIKADGSQKALVDRMQTRQELYDLLDYDMNGPT